MRFQLAFALVVALALPVIAQTSNSAPLDGKSWWRDVQILAADNMEGRETGSPGLAHAQAWVVEQLKKAGLQPAGTKGYYQPVHFVSRRLDEVQSSASLVRDGKARPLKLGEDCILSTRVDLAPAVDAPLVFAGWGLRIPEQNYDDLAGLDLKGKVVVLVSGAPESIPGAVAAHYQSAGERWKTLRAAGAVGVITIPNPASMDIPWPRIALNRNRPSMELAGPEFDETAGEKLAIYFNPEHADALFEGTGHTFAELAALAKDRKSLPRFPLAASIRVRTRLEKEPVESSNLVAVLPGSDPALKAEYVVLSAHLDHLGIGEPIKGDRVYHGAMDNAAGSAAILDVAEFLKTSSQKPRRSLLFLFVTGEEKGLLGSKYFAAHPTVDPKAIVADINVDMFLPIVPLKVLTVLGLNESDLGDLAKQAAATEGVAVQPDPMPQRNTFIRSDQYNFIRHGVPSLAMGVGFDGSDRQVLLDWLHDRYHAPADDLKQPVDLATAGKYETIVRDLVLEVADRQPRPQWKPDSFFRRYAKPAAD